MAQDVRHNENAVAGFSLGSSAPTKRAMKALTAITRAAESDRALADPAADLLESVLDVLSEQRATATMPAAEQAGWEELGARFGDKKAAGRARLRSKAAFAELVAASIKGDVAMAKLLGVDRSRVSQRLGERSLYAFFAFDVRLFPRWQLDGKRTVPHLRDVLRTVDAEAHPVTVSHWFVTPNLDLEVGDDVLSPRDWLLSGGSHDPVVALASQL